MNSDVLNFLESLKTFDGFVITEDYKVYHRDRPYCLSTLMAPFLYLLGSLATNRIATTLL